MLLTLSAGSHAFQHQVRAHVDGGRRTMMEREATSISRSSVAATSTFISLNLALHLTVARASLRTLANIWGHRFQNAGTRPCASQDCPEAVRTPRGGRREGVQEEGVRPVDPGMQAPQPSPTSTQNVEGGAGPGCQARGSNRSDWRRGSRSCIAGLKEALAKARAQAQLRSAQDRIAHTEAFLD